ncbi:MAG: PEP-CTERM sorting domain-containing protein [Candidatus Omnitrophota bacterium]
MGKLVALVSLAVLLVPGVASANLLVNGDFEISVDGDYAYGWSADAPDGWNAENQVVVTDNPVSGTHNLHNYNDGGMKQEVAITGGQSYNLTGYALVPSGTVANSWGSYIGVKFLRANGTLASKTMVDMKALTRDQYNLGDTGVIVAPSDAVTARIMFGTYANDPYEVPGESDFDNFNFDVAAVPEPASLLLLGSGLVGLMGLGRKK